jgi:hypothetical protein
MVEAMKLSSEQCAQAMAGNEFGDDVRKSAVLVAVILTQSWCPQWLMMRSWLGAALEEAGAKAFSLEYDNEPFFERFMTWKEDVLGNRSVPYVRYYRDGVLVAESNYTSRSAFVAHFSRGSR